MIELDKSPYNLTVQQIQKIQRLIASMSNEAKIGQLFFVIGQSGAVKELTAFIKKYQPGGMMYRPDNAEKLKDQLRAVQDASTIPLFLSANLESGGNGILT
ncbi:glycoside hydrolase family 3 protein, partial [Enterococcus gallinarum]|nr:glycoside hydrolase family 3 protein [Enterococcus gallinarum]